MRELILDSLWDCLRLLPFLFLTYLVVEYVEHCMSARAKEWIYRAGKAGPLLGSLIGLIPQCGFSAAAAGLFAADVISPGTLIAVFLSTSDEMLPIMLSEGMELPLVARILTAKVIAGVLIGYLVDFAALRLHLWTLPAVQHPIWKYSQEPGAFTPIRFRQSGRMDSPKSEGIVRSALKHTGQIFLFLFLISLVLALGMDWFTGAEFANSIFSVSGVQELIAALIGMIPNCAASVFITELFLDGVLRSGALFAGLLCGAGTGLLVLFRENPNRRENLVLLAVLYAGGVLAGLLIGYCFPSVFVL